MSVYTYPIPQVCLDDSALTRQLILPRIVICDSPDLVADPCQTYNATRCGNDPPYYWPVAAGDVIYLQYTLPDPINDWTGRTGAQGSDVLGWGEGEEPWLSASIYDTCTGVVTPLTTSQLATAWVGYIDPDAAAPSAYRGRAVQVIGIRVDTLPTSWLVVIDHVDLGRLYSRHVYRRVDCIDSVLLEGIYDEPERCTPNFGAIASCADVGCDGYLYGWPADQPYRLTTSDWLSYRNTLRLPGSIVRNGYTYEREASARGIVFSARATEQWRLRVGPLPDDVVERLAYLLMADRLAVNGDVGSVWQAPEGLQRQNELGTSWWIDATITRTTCERQRGCID